MRKKILLIAIPAAIHNLIDTLQLLIDILMIGRISPEAVAAVGLSGQLIILLYSFISIFHIGTNAISSRAFGSKDKEKAYETVFTGFLLSFLFSIPIFIFVFFYNSTFFYLMGVEKEVSELGDTYLKILSISIPFLFVGSVLYTGLASSGDTRTPLIIAVFSNIINTFLNYCLIFGNFGFPRLEVEGAAIATTISYITEVLIYLFIYLNGRKIKFSYRFSPEISKKIFKIGVPAGIEKFISFASFLVFVKIISNFGTYTLAGYQIGLRVEGLAFMPGLGFSTAAMVLVGQYIGAKKLKLAEKSVIENLKIASLFMGIVGIFLVLFPENIMSVFTEDLKTIKEGALYLKIVGLSQIPLAFDFVLNGALKGAGATKITLFINNFSFWIFRIIPAYIISIYTKEVIYIYLIMIFETFIKGMWLWILFKIGNWKNMKI
ncbi:putative efflux protein, MATE family [Persephonella hydrogeniphila]|uniref:Multidrug-efflux transporter n=1 Tax=Persephonella hydrogeniphila TaxID=198703 RepID=A0A285NPV6_9AQUI|nr:MATE family efflux transporter [Persephonella hydrogeniphila]SNZ11542.1 putative efflux protein, MATE family [Persephonella hydrogeniphila]